MKHETYILILVKKLMGKILNLKLVIFLEYQNINIYLQNVYTPNWFEEVSVIKKTKTNTPWIYIIRDFNVEEIVGTSYDKELLK